MVLPTGSLSYFLLCVESTAGEKVSSGCEASVFVAVLANFDAFNRLRQVSERKFDAHFYESLAILILSFV